VTDCCPALATCSRATAHVVNGEYNRLPDSYDGWIEDFWFELGVTLLLGVVVLASGGEWMAALMRRRAALIWRGFGEHAMSVMVPVLEDLLRGSGGEVVEQARELRKRMRSSRLAWRPWFAWWSVGGATGFPLGWVVVVGECHWGPGLAQGADAVQASSRSERGLDAVVEAVVDGP